MRDTSTSDATETVEHVVQRVESYRSPAPFQFAVLRGLQGKHVYAGTVPAAVVARRRAANAAARRSRRANRRGGAR